MKSRYIVLAFIVFFSGCQNNAPSAAPLGKKEVLQQLADAYKNIEEKLPVAAGGLTPKGKRKFVEDVFKQAGYDFAKTLQALSNIPQGNINTYHKDMMELLFLPQRGLSRADFKRLYSEPELDAIHKIESLFSQ